MVMKTPKDKEQEARKITLKRPDTKTIRVRVQEFEGQKAVKTRGLTLYGAELEYVYGLVKNAIEVEAGEKFPGD